MSTSTRGTPPEIRAVLNHVRAHGYTVELSRSNHWRVTEPAGRLVLTLPLTPGSRRTAADARQALRRAGIPPMPSSVHKPKAQRHEMISGGVQPQNAHGPAGPRGRRGRAAGERHQRSGIVVPDRTTARS